MKLTSRIGETKSVSQVKEQIVDVHLDYIEKDGYVWRYNEDTKKYYNTGICLMGKQGNSGPPGRKGDNGLSAYQIAREHGFDGNVQAWLDSLKGKSTYETAVENGFEGTEEEWLESLKGEDGIIGQDGVTPHIDSTTKHWMIGDEDSEIIAEGQDGANGKSAYQIWQEQPGNENRSVSEFLAWMKDTSSMIGPKYAATTNDCVMINNTPTLYYVPNGSTFDVYLADEQGVAAKSLATGVPGDITNYAGIYDISQDKAVNGVPATYGNLSEALGAITEDSKKKGGMTVTFIQGTGADAKYVQYRYVGTSIAGTDFENEINWMEEGVSNSYDDVLNIETSEGTPQSGGVTTEVTKVVDTYQYTKNTYNNATMNDGHYYITQVYNQNYLARVQAANATAYIVEVFKGDTVTISLTAPTSYHVICFSPNDNRDNLESGAQSIDANHSQVYEATAPYDGYAYISTRYGVSYIRITTPIVQAVPPTKRSVRLDNIEENIESLQEAVESMDGQQTASTDNVFDVSAANNKSYSSLQSALADVPTEYQHGWVTIAYKDTYDVYRKLTLNKEDWSTESSYWLDDIHDEFLLKGLGYTDRHPTPVLDSEINNGFYYIVQSGVLQTISNTAASACVTYRFPIQKGDVVYCTSTTGATNRAVISFGDEQRTNFQVGVVVTENQWTNTKYSAESPIDGYAYITKGVGANVTPPNGSALSVMVIPHSSKLIGSISAVKREILYPFFDKISLGHETHDCTFYDDNTILSAGYDGAAWMTWRDITTKTSTWIKVEFYAETINTTMRNQLKSLDYKFGKLLVGSGRAKASGETSYATQGSYVLIFNDVADWKTMSKSGMENIPTLTLNKPNVQDNCGTYKKIDFDISLGVKSYAFWAQRDDTIYLNTNFFKDIYLIRLGKGTHNLGSGTFVSAESGLYNGSYKVINHWHQDDDWMQDGEPLAAHGGEYHNGHLYLAVNKKDSCIVYKCILGYDGTLKFDEIHLDEYIEGNNTKYRYRYIDGLCFHDGKMYVQPLNVDDSNDNNKNYYLVAEV